MSNAFHINSKQTMMKKSLTAAFENDIKNIINNERIRFNISEAETQETREKNIILDFTTDEYNYGFRCILHNDSPCLSYDVTRIQKTNNPLYNGRFEKYAMFNDFVVEKVFVGMSNGTLVFGFFETLSFKQNSCKLCCDLDQDIRTFRCYKRHQKNKGHLKNVAFSNKFYADTIADATKLNDDVSMLITSYLF
jgi:hypothetical protein